MRREKTKKEEKRITKHQSTHLHEYERNYSFIFGI